MKAREMDDDDDDKDEQGDLFVKSPPLARNTDPETSHAAARSFKGMVAEAEFSVLRIIVARGELGATWDEVHAALDEGFAKASISPRWRPLMDKELIEYRYDADGKRVKRVGTSGRSQLVHYATAKGKAFIAHALAMA